MERWFGDCGCEGPSAFLQSHGFVLSNDWSWTKPTPAHRLSAEEKACVFFLMDEWDYDGCQSTVVAPSSSASSPLRRSRGHDDP